jgi:integrase
MPETEVPVAGILRKSPRRIPYLFSSEEVLGLLKAASNVDSENSLRSQTYTTILGLMATTGIRIGEAIRLTLLDVNLDSEPPRLEIRQTKFKKSRIVPLHPTAAEKLRLYCFVRTQRGDKGSDSPFFISGRRNPLCYETLRSWFARTTQALGMIPTGNRRSPTLHGFRHYFAVQQITRWCKSGKCVQELAPTLSVYLGHVSPEESYWYLTSTPALLLTANRSFERYVAGGSE